ncbi:DNA binding protein [Halogranum tailed virus 1]|uniref:Uncharacterized protein n=1 Tax=Halogranum tailed virus 1 TaxID=1273749 RepID=R4T973_9CAUD|nr:DNA binding protein [Halogranum tailed virus 1]AGM11450.1 hypothetical protein HGTV1_153 [Halogranum tailed virus 1]
MNCMWLDSDLKQAARNHATKHQTKLILEATQMACSALHRHGLSELSPYRATHKNHPMTLWAGDSFDNWLLLRDYAGALHEVRYGVPYEDVLDNPDLAEHKSMRKFAEIPERPVGLAMPNIGRTARPKCLGDFEPSRPDLSVEEAYREYYLAVKEPQDWFEWYEVPEWA